MTSRLIILCFLACLGCSMKSTTTQLNGEEALSVQESDALHTPWTELLMAHVKGKRVDYAGFVKDSVKLDSYCASLSNAPPAQGWTKEQQLAYWINAYNAFTVQLIVDNYPLESIQDLHPTVKIPGVSTVWHKTEFKYGNKSISLNDVEHKVLRKMNEPRIHFAINCASISCPPLRNEAYLAGTLEKQLQAQARQFVNDETYNEINEGNAKLSMIFKWFKSDFTNQGSLHEYLNQFSTTKLASDAPIDYLAYDWRLNE